MYLVNSLVLSYIYILLFLIPHYYSIILYISTKSSIRSSIRTTYNLRIKDHSSTYSYKYLPPWIPFNKHSAYRLLCIVHSSIYSSNCPYYISAYLVQISVLPSLRNHASHILSTRIIRPSIMNT